MEKEAIWQTEQTFTKIDLRSISEFGPFQIQMSLSIRLSVSIGMVNILLLQYSHILGSRIVCLVIPIRNI